MIDLDMDDTARLYHGAYIKEIERLRAETEQLREALVRIADLTSHNMPMTAGDEQCVYREATSALKQENDT